MRYIIAVNTGVGFITHKDWETMTFAGYPLDIWCVTGDCNEWITRNNGAEETRAVCQAMLDATEFRDPDGNIITITLP